MAFFTIGAKQTRAHHENDNLVKGVTEGRKNLDQLHQRIKLARAATEDLGNTVSEHAITIKDIREYVHHLKVDTDLRIEDLHAGHTNWQKGVTAHLNDLERFTTDQRDYTSKAIRDFEKDIAKLYAGGDKLMHKIEFAMHDVSRLEAELAAIKIPKVWPAYVLAFIGISIGIVGCFL